MTDVKQTQLVVIGAGPGGYAAAFKAADLGLQVALIDVAPNPGGVCSFSGCIPSKTLLHVAKVITEAAELEHYGVKFNKPKINVKTLREAKDAVVNKLTGGLGQLAKARKVEYIQGRASFMDSNTLLVVDEAGAEQVVRCDHTIVATGSRPATLPGIDLESPRLLNSTTALEVEDVPKTLLVVGGGYIGLELGSVYAALGTKVTVVEMTDGLLPGADRDLVKVLAGRIDEIMEAVLLGTKVTGMEEVDRGIQVTMEDADGAASEAVFEKVLVSIGRKPNSSGLSLNSTDVEVDERGFVRVNHERRTADPRIFAIGDIAGEPMLAHKATHEGRVAAEAVAGETVAFEPRAIPAVVFTDPEIAWAGLTELEAEQQGIDIQVSKFPWGASGRATTLQRNDGLTKVIAHPESKQVLGIGIVGPSAGELIAQGVLAIEMGALASDLSMSIHPHPTLSETVMESAEMIFGQSAHFYRPRKD
jgi:dihydrolipoyl dehydrogenase